MGPDNKQKGLKQSADDILKYKEKQEKKGNKVTVAGWKNLRKETVVKKSKGGGKTTVEEVKYDEKKLTKKEINDAISKGEYNNEKYDNVILGFHGDIDDKTTDGSLSQEYKKGQISKASKKLLDKGAYGLGKQTEKTMKEQGKALKDQGVRSGIKTSEGLMRLDDKKFNKDTKYFIPSCYSGMLFDTKPSNVTLPHVDSYQGPLRGGSGANYPISSTTTRELLSRQR